MSAPNCASARSTFFPCCYIQVHERWTDRNTTLTRDLVGSPQAGCTSAYSSELNSVDCTPPRGCRMDIVEKYAGPDLLRHYSDGGYLSLFTALALLPETVMTAGSPRALVIGGGAGEMATTLTTHFRTLEIDVLEPDATVIRMARRHFGFDASVWRDGARVHAGTARYERVRVLETDALRWLQRVASSEAFRYDYVVLDAYVTKERSVTDMPDVFASAEFCAALAAALQPHGVVTAQLFRNDQNGAAFRRHCERIFERSFLMGHHRLPREAQWWSVGQRVVVLAGSGAADARAADAPCTREHAAVAELDRFAVAASQLSTRSRLPYDLGRLVRGRHYEFRLRGRRCS